MGRGQRYGARCGDVSFLSILLVALPTVSGEVCPPPPQIYFLTMDPEIDDPLYVRWIGRVITLA